jgi:hypothetical protein
MRMRLNQLVPEGDVLGDSLSDTPFLVKAHAQTEALSGTALANT